MTETASVGLFFSNLIFSEQPMPVFGRLVFLCALMFVAGRACVDLLLIYARRSGPDNSILRNPNYVSVAFGPTVVLLLTWALKGLGLYSFAAMLLSLVGLIAVAAFCAPPFRAFVRRPWKEIDIIAVAYAAGIFAFWIMVGVNEHRYLRGSAIYLLQGFNLFFSNYAAEIPHYGQTFVAPFFYVGHTMSATFGLLSYGSHFAYYAYGVYFLNLLIAPLIPIGAYLFFRRYLGTWLALVAACLFCWGVLDFKIWSLRAEALAWIIGFAFLMVLGDVLTALRKSETPVHALRPFPLLTLLFFSLSLTHSVTTFIVAVFSAAYVFYFVAERWSRTELLLIGRLATMSLLPLLLLFVVLAFTYSGTPLPIEQTATRPPTGDLDAAIQFDNAWAGGPLDLDAPKVRAAPPYTSTKFMAEGTAFLPVASWFRPNISAIPLKQFPSGVIENVISLPTWEKLGYCALLALCFALYLSPFAALADRRHRYLFWTSSAIYFCIIALSVYLNWKSISLYPLASIRRAFVYVGFFYWLAIGIAVFDFIIHPLIIFYATTIREHGASGTASLRFRSIRHLSGTRRAVLTTLLVICFVPLWVEHSIVRSMPHDGGSLLGRMTHRVEVAFGRQPADPGGFAIVEARLRPLFDAVGFIRDHTAVGERIFSNVSSSDNAFWFLSSGRYSLMEGASIYQLYSLQKEAARRMNEFAIFALTADPAIVAPYGTRYVLLYKDFDCGPIQCYGDNILTTNRGSFDANPLFRQVFENEFYVIYEMSSEHEAGGRSNAGGNTAARDDSVR